MVQVSPRFIINDYHSGDLWVYFKNLKSIKTGSPNHGSNGWSRFRKWPKRSRSKRASRAKLFFRFLREVPVAADQVFHVVGHRQAGGRTNDRVQQRPVVRQPYGYDSRLVAGHDLFAVRRHFHRGDRRLMSLSVKTSTWTRSYGQYSIRPGCRGTVDNFEYAPLHLSLSLSLASLFIRQVSFRVSVHVSRLTVLRSSLSVSSFRTCCVRLCVDLLLNVLLLYVLTRF